MNIEISDEAQELLKDNRFEIEIEVDGDGDIEFLLYELVAPDRMERIDSMYARIKG